MPTLYCLYWVVRLDFLASLSFGARFIYFLLLCYFTTGTTASSCLGRNTWVVKRRSQRWKRGVRGRWRGGDGGNSNSCKRLSITLQVKLSFVFEYLFAISEKSLQMLRDCPQQKYRPLLGYLTLKQLCWTIRTATQSTRIHYRIE